ncbi:hypothetical protein HZA96_02810 [Candidatus Woesearchaeota archaeon]|nr:hypothetical protein [Candidatus Woesearchaeota archaeon]
MEFKGLLHVHSTYSRDGKYNIQQIREFYKDYDFITITNHYEHCSERFDEIISEIDIQNNKPNSIGKKQLILFGFEYQYNYSHILFIGHKGTMPTNLEKIKALIKEKKPLVILAHPQMKDFELLKKSLIDSVDGFEVYNSLHTDKQCPAFHLLRKLKEMREKKSAMKAFFGEDFHNGVNSDTAIYVTAEKLASTDIIQAMKNGDYYIKNRYFTYYPDGRFIYAGKKFLPLTKSYCIGAVQYLSQKFGKVLSYFPYSSAIKEKLHKLLQLLFGRI